MFKAVNATTMVMERDFEERGFRIIDLREDDNNFKQRERAEYNRRLQEIAAEDPAVALWLKENKELVDSF